MSTERNQFLEMDGLYWESETHEWFNDKSSTNYAQTDNGLNKDALKNIHCFVTRNKETGEYDRVIMDSKKNQVIFDTKSLEELSFEIDRMKIQKRFKM
jgi:hypothetical protein